MKAPVTGVRGMPNTGGGGTQIWIDQGCAADSSRPIPMFRGNISKNRYPYLGIFLKKVPISCNFAVKTHKIFKISHSSHSKHRKFLKIIVMDLFIKNDTCVQGFLAKNRPKIAAHPVHVLSCEYPPSGAQLSGRTLDSSQGSELEPHEDLRFVCLSNAHNSNLHKKGIRRTIMKGQRASELPTMHSIFYNSDWAY